MTSFQKLIQQVLRHSPYDNEENKHQQDTLHLLNMSGEKCLYRDHLPGHITSSAIILSPDSQKVLFHKHLYLNIWCGFGGHADGDSDIYNVSIKEALEESGLRSIKPLSKEIFDIDIHTIPPNPLKKERKHQHYCLSYLFKISRPYNEEFGPEGAPLKWVKISQITKYCDNLYHQRLQDKMHLLNDQKV